MRLRIDLAYDGTDFRGWAIQPGLRTVQGHVEVALQTALRVPAARVVVAGRTDTGVHARGQVIHVDVDPIAFAASTGRSTQAPTEALLRRLNGIMAPDVRVRRVVEAADGFDARFSALWRRYAYRVADSSALVDPLVRSQVLVWSRPLDLDAMNLAAEQFFGHHDFASFCRPRPGATTIRTLLDLTWSRDESGLAVADVRADAFCRSMVRAIVGCLMAVGDGRQQPEWAVDVLRSGVRNPAAPVSRARGLTLEEVAYPADDELGGQAVLTRTKRLAAGSAREDTDG